MLEHQSGAEPDGPAANDSTHLQSYFTIPVRIFQVAITKKRTVIFVPIYKTKKKNKYGDFQYRVTYNYTDTDGNYRQKSKLVYGYAEAKTILSKLESQKDFQEDSKSITVQTLYDNYISSKTHEVRESSLRKTEGVLNNHILPYLKDTKLKNLTTKKLEVWKQSVSEKDIKVSTKRNAYKEFRAMLNYAVRVGDLKENPLLKIGNFKDPYNFDIPEEKIQYYTVEEYKKYISGIELNTVKDWAYYTFFSMAFYTGLRKGENNAVSWKELNGNILNIRRSATQKLKGKSVVFTPPKNKASYRKLQIPKPLMEILKKQKELQQKNYTNWSEDFLICGGEKCLGDTAISNKNIELAKKAGLKTIRIHDFRHTHATLLINEGINIQEIARRLGHSDVQTTLKVYSHLYPREEERAIKVLDSI